jgi:hypothetical protein
MAYVHEVPSDEQVVAALEELGGQADAITLCEKLMSQGHPELQSQLAIQRAAERRRLVVERDWTLSVPAQQNIAA